MEQPTATTPPTTNTHKKRTDKSEVPVGTGAKKARGEQPGGGTTEDGILDTMPTTMTGTTTTTTTTTVLEEKKTTIMPSEMRLNAAELTSLHTALCLESQCFVKNTMLMLLSGDRTGMIRFWHDNVTKPNLERLIPMATAMGLTLPWTKPLETREMELRAMLTTTMGAITDGEALAEIKAASKLLSMNYTCGFECSNTADCMTLFSTLNTNVLANLPKLCETMKTCDNYFPVPQCDRLIQTTVDTGLIRK